MNERIYIPEVQSELQYKDRRSVRRWCCNNLVRVLSDTGSNKYYVMKGEYEKAKSRNYFQSLNNQNSTTNIFSQNHNAFEKRELEYSPQFEYEKRTLSILQNITRTL